MSIFGQVARLLRPPRVVGVTRRPAGCFAVDHRSRPVAIVAWGVLTDGKVVALVASRGGLRPAVVGRGWRFVPAAPMTVPVADLAEAIGDAHDLSVETQAAIYGRLKIAAKDEWATGAIAAFFADPARFLHRYFERLAEHSHVADIADVDATWRDRLDASLTSPAVGAAINPVIAEEATSS